MKKIAVAFLFCLTGTIANAQPVQDFRQINKPVLCGPAQLVLKALAEPDINEKPIWIGRNEDDRSDFLIFVNPNNNGFTILQVGKEIGCILGIGYKSEFLQKR